MLTDQRQTPSVARNNHYDGIRAEGPKTMSSIETLQQMKATGTLGALRPTLFAHTEGRIVATDQNEVRAGD